MTPELCMEYPALVSARVNDQAERIERLEGLLRSAAMKLWMANKTDPLVAEIDKELSAKGDAA